MEDYFISKEFLLLIIEGLRDEYTANSQEPIPCYTDREIDELYNCIFRVYSNGYIQTNLERIVTIMFNITKNHYLSNGNKRIAVIITCMLFVIELGSFPYDVEELKNIVLQIADGTLATKEDALLAVEELVRYE